MMRKPIGVAAVQVETGEKLVVVCDDGTAWQLNMGQWHPLPRIPGTEDRRPVTMTGNPE